MKLAGRWHHFTFNPEHQLQRIDQQCSITCVHVFKGYLLGSPDLAKKNTGWPPCYTAHSFHTNVSNIAWSRNALVALDSVSKPERKGQTRDWISSDENMV